MTLRTARLIHMLSKIFMAISTAGLIAFFVFYIMGRTEFKFLSLPLMACLISLMWLVMSRTAIKIMEKESNSVDKREVTSK